MDAIIQSMQAMLKWPAPLKLRPLAATDAAPLAAMIVAVLAEFQFEWLATPEQLAKCEKGKAASIRHDAALCTAEPARTAFWVLVDSRDDTPVGCVGIRRCIRHRRHRVFCLRLKSLPRACCRAGRASADGNGTGWGERAWEKPGDTETGELHALYLAKRYRGKGLGRRLFDTAEVIQPHPGAAHNDIMWTADPPCRCCPAKDVRQNVRLLRVVAGQHSPPIHARLSYMPPCSG